MFSWCTRAFPRKPCPLGIPVDKTSSRNWKVEVYLRRSMPPGQEHAPWSGIVAVTMAQLTAVGEKKEEKDKKGRYQGQRNKRDAKIEDGRKRRKERGKEGGKRDERGRISRICCLHLSAVSTHTIPPILCYTLLSSRSVYHIHAHYYIILLTSLY